MWWKLSNLELLVSVNVDGFTNLIASNVIYRFPKHEWLSTETVLETEGRQDVLHFGYCKPLEGQSTNERQQSMRLLPAIRTIS